MASTRQPTMFLDLCAASVPLQAIARRLHYKDQLRLAHAVGKQHRDAVCAEITELPLTRLLDFGRAAIGYHTAKRFLQRLEGIERASWWEHRRCHGNIHRVQLVRYLSRLTHLEFHLHQDWRNPAGDDEGYQNLCQHLGALTTLKSLKLHSMSFEYAALKTTGVQHLSTLSRLTQLTLDEGSFEVQAMETLAKGLMQLRNLDLTDTIILGADLSPLQQLTCLRASQTCVALESFSALQHLQYLDLSMCDIDVPECCHLSTCTNLTELSLASCHLMDADVLGYLSNLVSLTFINLTYAHVTPASLESLQAIPNLHTLWLDDCELEPAHAMAVSKSTQVIALNIYDNPSLGDEGARYLACMSSLQSLGAHRCGFTAQGASHLANGLTALTCLAVCSNPLGVAGIAHIARLPNLQSLSIVDCNLGDDGAQQLGTWTNLAHVTIRM